MATASKLVESSDTHTDTHTVTLCPFTPRCHHLSATLSQAGSRGRQGRSRLSVGVSRDIVGTGSSRELDVTRTGTLTLIKKVETGHVQTEETEKAEAL